MTWACPYRERELVVVGSNKRIVFNDLDVMERVKIYAKGVVPVAPEATNFGEFQFLMRDGDILSPRVEGSEPLKNQCKHFIECIAQGKRPRTDGQAGLNVVRVMTAIERSMAQYGTPVWLDNLDNDSSSIPQKQELLQYA